MKKDSEFLRMSLKLGSISAVNSAVLGLGGIWISRELGPELRGVLTKMLLIFVVLGIATELGVLSAATYFSSFKHNSSMQLLKFVHRNMIRNLIWIGSPFVLVCFFVGILNFNQLLIISLSLVVGNLFSGPSHVLQGQNIELWRKVQSTQSLAYIVMFSFVYFQKVNVFLAFFMIAIPGIFSGLVARIYLKKIISKQPNSLKTQEVIPRSELQSYSHSSFWFILFTELSNRIELLYAALFLTNREIGTLALLVSWLSISSPFANSVGHIVFPQVARDHALSSITTRSLFVYSRNTFLTSLVLTIGLIVVMPFTLNRFVEGVYSGLGNHILLVSLIVITRQLNTVFSEMVRGLNLNAIYSWILFTTMLAFLTFLFIYRPTGIHEILLFAFSGQIVNLVATVILIRLFLCKVGVK